jgi:hypothetical protein
MPNAIVPVRAQCYKKFYCHNLLPFHGHTVILCYKTLYYGKYNRMAVNTLIKSFITLTLGGKHKYRGNLPQYFNTRISRVKITMVIYRSIVL